MSSIQRKQDKGPVALLQATEPAQSSSAKAKYTINNNLTLRIFQNESLPSRICSSGFCAQYPEQTSCYRMGGTCEWLAGHQYMKAM